MKKVEWGGFAEACAVLVDDGCLLISGAVVAYGDGLFGEVGGWFVASCLVLEGVVCADFTGDFVEEDFFIVVGGLKPLDAV